MPHTDRRLIEDLIPIREISAEASEEKRKTYGNISTLHLWWARRPLIASRAAVYSTLVPAPGDMKKQEIYKERMKSLCQVKIPPEILAQARKDILDANGGQPPQILDMFAGGGSIPLEALRLGCKAYAIDLNPVAHIVELCTMVYPQNYGPTLIADVKRWGTWVIERAEAQLAEFYRLPINMSEIDSDIVQTSLTDEQEAIKVKSLIPIAYLWTRTVTCSNPSCGAVVPLVRQTWLRKESEASKNKINKSKSSNKTDKYVALRMLLDSETKRVCFKAEKAAKQEELGFDPDEGSKGGNAQCRFCGATANVDYIKEQGKSKQIGFQMMAIVAKRPKVSGKVYLAPFMLDTEAIEKRIEWLCKERNLTLPDELLPQQGTLGFRVQAYGMLKWKDLFTPRQLLSLLTFTAEVHQAYITMLSEGVEEVYATAITTYLGLMVDRLAENLSSLCRWNAVGGKLQGTFGHQSLPMVWDFAEANPFGGSVGDASSILSNISEILEYLTNINDSGVAVRTTATHLPAMTSTAWRK